MLRRGPGLALALLSALLPAGACRAGSGRAGTAADSPEAAGRRFTLAVAGDVLVHRPVAAATARDGAYDFEPLLAEPARLVAAADLAVCHLETPLVRPAEAPAYGPTFAVPGELAAGLAGAGWDSCSTASNHSLDGGPRGVRTTLDVLDEAGVRHAGTARDAAEAARPHLTSLAGIEVGLLSYADGFNPGEPGSPDPAAILATQPWLAARLIEPAVLADARRLRRAGAEFVVVSLHWGTEYEPGPDRRQAELARRLLSSPAVDLIVGHHAHVVQPIGRIGDKYALFGLGNLLAGQADRCCPSPRDGVVVVAEVAEGAGGWRVRRLTYAPTVVEPATYRVRLVGAALADPDLAPEARRGLAESWCVTAAGLGALGVNVVATGPVPDPPVDCPARAARGGDRR